MISNSVILVVFSLTSLASAQVFWIQSPKVTDWGVWGPPEFCNNNEYVYGFRLKVQLDQGPLLDDTALNAIELHCIQTFNGPRTLIKSKEGIKGNWGTTKECPGNSYGMGFEMRTEAPTTIDNTAANNFRLYCSDGTMLEGVGMEWGAWTGAMFCPTNYKICGIKVQVEDPVGGAEPKGGTGVNNVDMQCCDRAGNSVKMSKKY